MARKSAVAAIHIAGIVSSIATGCFSTQVLTGSPCGKDGSCGEDLRCSEEHFCQPASCEGNSQCVPYSVACAADGGGQECPEVGARGCFFAEAEPNKGYCALTCEDSKQCPGVEDATATAACVVAATDEGVVNFCALDCGDARTCPANMHCVDVEIAGATRSLCMSGES